MNLFRGYELAHGQYRVQKEEADGKMSGRAVTVSEPATENNFEDHLRWWRLYIRSHMLMKITPATLGLLILILEARLNF